MAIRFGTEDWARALEAQIRDSSEYRQAAAAWGVGFNGNVLLAFEPDDARPEGLGLLLRLGAGECRGAEFVADASHPDAAFALRGPFSLWRDIFERRTLAATAILTGKMKVEGDKMTLLKHTAAHRALVACAAAIDTEF